MNTASLIVCMLPWYQLTMVRVLVYSTTGNFFANTCSSHFTSAPSRRRRRRQRRGLAERLDSNDGEGSAHTGGEGCEGRRRASEEEEGRRGGRGRPHGDPRPVASPALCPAAGCRSPSRICRVGRNTPRIATSRFATSRPRARTLTRTSSQPTSRSPSTSPSSAGTSATGSSSASRSAWPGVS